MEFEGRVVLVTGAGRGVGRAVAEAFGVRGAIVAANDITPVNLDETLARVRAGGGRIKDYVFDVAKKMPVQSMVAQVIADWGRIDVLVNSAQVEPGASLLEMNEWDWHRTIDVNLGGPFLTMQAVGRVMREQGSGVVVNIASTAGRAHRVGDRPAYVASKTGLIGLTRAAARELAAYHVRVNAVCPGEIAAEEGHSLSTSPAPGSGRAGAQDFPQGRLGRPQDVAQVVLFLCSDAAAYVIGQAIIVDGGQVMS